LLDGIDVTDRIRESCVNQSIKAIADNANVRSALVQLQRRWCLGRDAVTEGRDQGTVAFPEASCKIFLTASSQERARRRWQQLREQGIEADYDAILMQQNQRDEDDTTRKSGGLKAAADAIKVETDGMSEADVLNRLLEIVRSRM
jgi:cytidylate kinase